MGTASAPRSLVDRTILGAATGRNERGYESTVAQARRSRTATFYGPKRQAASQQGFYGTRTGVTPARSKSGSSRCDSLGR